MGKFQSRSTKKEPQIEVGDKDDEASLSAEETLVDADGLSKSVGSSHKLKDQQRRAQTETTTSEASRGNSVLSSSSIPSINGVQFDKIAFESNEHQFPQNLTYEVESSHHAHLMPTESHYERLTSQPVPRRFGCELQNQQVTPQAQIKSEGFWNQRPTWVTATSKVIEGQPAKRARKTEATKKPRQFFLNPNYTPYASTPCDPDLDPLSDQNVDFALLEDGVTVDINHEYLQDHINALLERENDFIAGITYAMGHPDFNPKDRRIVVNWMIELSYLLQLPPTVIHLAVNIMDRYLSKSSIFKEQLEQIALASMSLASKHETALHPYPRDLLRQAKIDVSQSKLAQIEKEILISLDFRVSYPNPITFVRNASLADDSYLKTRLMSRFFLESFLLDSYFCKFPPSRLASFAFYISLKVLKRGGWGPEFERFTGCSRGALCRSARSMFEHLVNLLRTQDAPFVHYGSLEYHKVSADASNWVKRTETIFSKSI